MMLPCKPSWTVYSQDWESCQVALPITQITAVDCDLTGSAIPGNSFEVGMYAPLNLPGSMPQYSFYYKAGYGTEAWNTNKWQLVQQWSAANETSYTLPAANNYYVIGHVGLCAVAPGAGVSWKKGDPQGGFTVDCSGDVQIREMYNDILSKPRRGNHFT